MDTVKFRDKYYPIKNIKMPFGERTISIENLNNVLMSSDGSYVSEEARIIDEQLFYYVENDSIHLIEFQLSARILSEIDSI